MMNYYEIGRLHAKAFYPRAALARHVVNRRRAKLAAPPGEDAPEYGAFIAGYAREQRAMELRMEPPAPEPQIKPFDERMMKMIESTSAQAERLRAERDGYKSAYIALNTAVANIGMSDIKNAAGRIANTLYGALQRAEIEAAS